ncbi:hypothetical protein [Nocardioides panacisoli]|uniref:DUF4367 domain-containing protein n=1 Tax=Nocardioides panacisoli TaxID=627624 RepID=A0ABP7IAM6_9ACTN
MTDVLDRLARLAHDSGSPGDATVTADLARGHAALARRRRTTGALAGVGLTLALGAGLGGVVAVQHGGDGSVAVTPDGAPSKGQRIALVDYTGAQPEGFNLAKVPEGYVVQGSDQFVLTLAKPDDTSSYLSFAHKVVISLQSADATGEPKGTAVDVGGKAGVIESAPDSLSRSLYYDDGKFTVEIEVWRNVGLTDEQLVELAEGVTVNSDVVQAPVG